MNATGSSLRAISKLGLPSVFQLGSLLLYVALLLNAGLAISDHASLPAAPALIGLVTLALLSVMAGWRLLAQRPPLQRATLWLIELLALSGSILVLAWSVVDMPWPWLAGVALIMPLGARPVAGLFGTLAVAAMGAVLHLQPGSTAGTSSAALLGLLFIGAISTVLAHLLRQQTQLSQAAAPREPHAGKLLDLTSQVVLITDSTARILYVNQAVSRLLGYSASEITERRVWPPIHPSDQRAHQQQKRQLLEVPEAGVLARYRTQHRDGHWVCLQVNGHNRLHDPAINGLVFLIDGIDERQALETELHEQKTLLRAVLDLSPSMIFAKDSHGHFIAGSQSFQRRLGYASADEMRDKTIYDALLMQAPPGRELEAFQMAEQIHQQDLQVMASGLPLEDVDLPGFLESDRRSWFKTTKYPLRDSGGHIIGLLGFARDITDRHEYQLRLEHQALHDPLTGLPNQRYLLTALASAITQFHQSRQPLAVLFCDLDFFKSINSTHGHEFGDQCLSQLTRRILAQLPPQTVVSRFGSDEFMVLLEHANLGIARTQAETILAALAQPLTIGDIVVKIPASIGITLLGPGHHSPYDVIREADAAMHQAKEHGRNRVELYDPQLQGSATRQARMDIALRFALERNELTLVYQPKVSLADGTLQGFELLMRWHSPQFGSISPTEFIPVAEASGLVVPLGLWALEQACMQLQRWQLAYPHQDRLIIAVNVSMRQLLQPNFLDQVTTILQQNRIAPACIELELTETSAMANPQQTIETLARMKKLGVRLALDDFGTGYSSLAYLQRLPLDVLKIDKAFVHGLGSSCSDYEIISLILALSKTLKLDTVAEGVETPAHITELTRLGCTLGQGFIFSNGVAPEQAQKFLDRGYRFAASLASAQI